MPFKAQGAGWMAKQLWVGLPCLWTSAEEAPGGRLYQPRLQVCLAQPPSRRAYNDQVGSAVLESGARQPPQVAMPVKVCRKHRTWAARDG